MVGERHVGGFLEAGCVCCLYKNRPMHVDPFVIAFSVFNVCDVYVNAVKERCFVLLLEATTSRVSGPDCRGFGKVSFKVICASVG